MHGRVSAQSADFFGHVGKSRFRCAGPANAGSRMNKQGKDPAGSHSIFNHATHFAPGKPAPQCEIIETGGREGKKGMPLPHPKF